MSNQMRFIVFGEDENGIRSVKDIFLHDIDTPQARRRLKKMLSDQVADSWKYQKYFIHQEDPRRPDVCSQDITWIFLPVVRS
jgi:hypothetical protein